jgi:hypothetical protein
VSYGFYSTGTTGNVTLISDIIASNASQGVYITTATMNVKISGNQTSSQNGTQAVVCFKYLVDPTPTAARLRYAKSGVGTYSDFFTADYGPFNQANASDVRSGVSYASGLLTGTCNVPSANSVALGIPVDNTVGLAVLRPQDIWNMSTLSLTAVGTIGDRLKNVSTVATVGSQLAALTT